MRQVKLSPEKCVLCESCLIACTLEHSALKGTNAFDINAVCLARDKTAPRLGIKAKDGKPQLVICRNCKKPKCVEACETGAIYKKEGSVIIDDDRCDGCNACVDACPYRAVWKNPAGTVPVKCDSCLGEEPACVCACPTEALQMSEEDEEADD